MTGYNINSGFEGKRVIHQNGIIGIVRGCFINPRSYALPMFIVEATDGRIVTDLVDRWSVKV